MLPSSSALAGSSTASTSSDTYEQTLHAALTGGVLTQDEYETKMKVHRQSTAPLAVATRPYGDGVVAKYDWLPAAGPFATKTLAVQGARAFDHGKWKWNQGHGDKKVMVCNAHVDCPVKLRFVPNKTDSTVSVEVSHVAHSLAVNQKPRSNSAFTFDQLEEVKKGTNHGHP